MNPCFSAVCIIYWFHFKNEIVTGVSEMVATNILLTTLHRGL